MVNGLFMRTRGKIPILTALLLLVCLGGVAGGEDAAAPDRASTVTAVEIGSAQTLLQADGPIGRYRFFRLDEPHRLVVDLYDVRPGFDERSFSGTGALERVRVGIFDDRTRFVFDAPENVVASAQVRPEGNAIAVSFPSGAGTASAAAERPRASAAPVPPPSASPRISVTAVEFEVKGGKSILTVDLSGSTEIVEPVFSGNVVRFGVVNASIDRALRRTIDTSAFPSAILRITPYTALEHGRQEVRFATELKGDVPYALRREGNRLIFEVENRQFAQAPAPAVETQRLPVLNASPESRPRPEAATAPAAAVPPSTGSPVITMTGAETAVAAPRGREYGGERISLVFDNADIRSILQLIGEVSNLNIIASEAVRGTVTLRLVDVPWDQALDLILETNGLGMLRDGNVVRILPRGEIRAMRQAELTAARDERQLEPLITQVIPVSYADLGAIVGPSRELLTDRGKVTADPRNKQIIVTDISPIIDEVRRLVRILDTPERQVMIEARIVEANSTFQRDLGVRWGISHRPETGDISRIDVGMGGGFLVPLPAPGTAGTSAGLGSGITFGRLGIDSTVLDLRISALENAGHGKVVSTPRVTTLNGGRALISQGTKIPYQTVSDQGTQTQFENAELRLEVSPVINPDNSVILDIRASNSSVGATVPTGLGGTAIAIDERRAETKVLVRDGETTVIGGIFVESERESEVGVPLLMRVPILGHFFKSTTTASERRELLVFITPRILN